MVREHAVIYGNKIVDSVKDATRILDGVWILARSKIGKGCLIGSNVVISNGSRLGNNVVIGDAATLGGFSVVNESIRIGKHAMIAGASKVNENVLPCSLVQSRDGDSARTKGINIVGLKRHRFTRNQIKNAFSSLYFLYPKLERHIEIKTSLIPTKIESTNGSNSTSNDDCIKERARELRMRIQSSVREDEKIDWLIGDDMSHFILNGGDVCNPYSHNHQRHSLLGTNSHQLVQAKWYHTLPPLSSSKDVDIHPTSIVHESARIGKGVKIGPFCTIGENVEIGNGTKIVSHAVIDSFCKIGDDCILHPFSVIGGQAQDKKLISESLKNASNKYLVNIGNGCEIHEAATVHASTSAKKPTLIKNNVLIHSGAHVGHDCSVGDNVNIQDGSQIGGHCCIGKNSLIGSNSLIHQQVNIGHFSTIHDGSAVSRHVIPFTVVGGNRARLISMEQVEKLKQIESLSEKDKESINQLLDILLQKDSRKTLKESLQEFQSPSKVIKDIIAFINHESAFDDDHYLWETKQKKRGFCTIEC